jgi:hypothetical protein
MEPDRRASGHDDGMAAVPEALPAATRRLDEAELVGILAALRVAGAALERALVTAKRIEREPGPLSREFGSALAVLATTEEDVIRMLSEPWDDANERGSREAPADGTVRVR